jgi:thioredoxin-dependent peroxiredoxin
MLKVDSIAPDFALPDQDGEIRKLSDFKGSWLLLYFYPKDDTPGCTKEACAIRDNYDGFNKIEAEVVGVSADSPEKHQKFINKYDLPFTLLSDTEKKMLRKYKVWGEKKFMGKSYEGISRASYLIDPPSVIKKVYPKVNPESHAQEVIEDLKDLMQKPDRDKL